MKFDELVNLVVESTATTIVPEMARPKNPEFQKWKEENPGVPTYKFFVQQRAKRAAAVQDAGGAVPPPAATASTDVETVPSVTGDTPGTEVRTTELVSSDPATERTKLAVYNYLSLNPDATVEEVINGIASENNEETPLNMDPIVIKAIVDQEQTAGATTEPGEEELSHVEEPGTADLDISPTDKDEEEALSSKRSDLDRKYELMRKALYKHHGFSDKPGKKVPTSVKDVLDDDDEDEDEDKPSKIDWDEHDPNED